MALMLSLAGSGVVWAEQPSMLIYMSPERYNHPTVVGVAPMYTRWVYQAEAAENAAFKAMSAKFKDVGVCDGGKSADVVAWVKPRLVYNPAVGTYFAILKLELHLGDGRTLATYKATGQHNGSITSIYMDDEVNRAYDDAMRQIMAQMQADTALQNNIQSAITTNFTRSPCGMVSVLSAPKAQDDFSIKEYLLD